MDSMEPNLVFSLSLTISILELLCTISFSNRVMPLYIHVSLSSDSAMAGL